MNPNTILPANNEADPTPAHSSATPASDSPTSTPISLLDAALADSGFTPAGSFSIPARPGRLRPVPAGLHPQLGIELRARHPDGLYSHQAEAISQSLSGRDVCLATSTASGKSLVFMSVAAHELLSDPAARVLVLYPAKALIQDQLAKWAALLSPLAMKVGFIDGTVPVGTRHEILATRRVVLMTPDVVQAWFMGQLADPRVQTFRTQLRLLILDEAHVYDGVFGTNMAFLLRRLQAAAVSYRMICSTATLGKASEFIAELTGRTPALIGPEQEGARVAGKEILVARRPAGDPLDAMGALLRRLATEHPGRFIAFGDSRKLVEIVTSISHRNQAEDPTVLRTDDTSSITDDAPPAAAPSTTGILPYRAGYESADRLRIQEALTSGALRGIVSTSAMEMGLDIGEVDLVVLLDTPSSMKSFWQRVGRAGRRNPGRCVILDIRGAIDPGPGGLADFLARPIEPNWLYLKNRYAQYTNALCAAHEANQLGGHQATLPFESLPPEFIGFLQNELNPTTSVAPDLYPLKQAAQNDPHHEFPLRNGIEQGFQIRTQQGDHCGEATYSQVLREAYPGAVYYYMARPYRVFRFAYRDGEVFVHPEKRVTTKPVGSAMVFPDFTQEGRLLHRFEGGFLGEVDVQVSERVTGFREKRGKTETPHVYGPGSPYSQQPMMRYIRTTGVCWSFAQSAVVSEGVAQALLRAFCDGWGVQERDLGIGRFHSERGPDGLTRATGICIYDNCNGSLRLTERLALQFHEVVTAALRRESASTPGPTQLTAAIEQLAQLTRQRLVHHRDVIPLGGVPSTPSSPDWTPIAVAGTRAMLVSTAGPAEVTILGYLYTPAGLQYQLQHDSPTVRWLVPAAQIEFIHGVTRTLLYNLMTGEEQAAS